MRALRQLFIAILIIVALHPSAEARDVESLIKQMTLEEKIGQLLLPAFRSENGNAVTKITPQVAAAIRRYHLGGVILFRENLVTPEQTIALTGDIQAAGLRGIPLFIGIDQEGGRITRLPYGIVMPGNMALGATGKPENAFLAAKAIGRELASLGINLNFAPVLDSNSNPDNPVIGVRSFSEDPDLVSQMGKAFLRGLHSAGVAAAVKHFPGHGDTSVDSHLGLPSLPYSIDRLEQLELKPFRATLPEQPDMVMTAHIALPSIESETVVSAKDGSRVSLPATLSHPVLTGVLRERLGFSGVIVTDALNMKAIAEHFGPADAAVRAILAGADVLLMPELEPAQAALLAAVKRGEISEDRINQSVRRVLEVKAKRGLLALRQPTLLSGEENAAAAALQARLASDAVTLVKNENVLPFVLRPGMRTVLFAPSPALFIQAKDETTQILENAGLQKDQLQAFDYSRGLTELHHQAIRSATEIILLTESADKTGRDPEKSRTAATAARIWALAEQTGKPLAVVAARNPYDIVYLQDAPAFLAVYAPVTPNIAAGLRVIFGLAEPRGKLPVTIPAADGSVLFPRGFGLSYKAP